MKLPTMLKLLKILARTGRVYIKICLHCIIFFNVSFQVPLTLSTGTAAIGGTPPELKAAVIGFVHSKVCLYAFQWKW